MIDPAGLDVKLPGGIVRQDAGCESFGRGVHRRRVTKSPWDEASRRDEESWRNDCRFLTLRKTRLLPIASNSLHE
jgi:hypothetical protein